MATRLEKAWKSNNQIPRQKPIPFRFFPVANKSHVLNEGLWPFDDNILPLIELRGLKQLLEVELAKARFWVKAMDVPPLKQTSSFAKVLGRQSRDDPNLYCAADKSVNFQVDMDVTKPLCRGISLMIQGKPIWISFKYVKLPEFYYRHGKLGPP
ncbi:hypothetical protein Cgig2_027673 [Carnegiea gigantea]|uniref:Uncharacterized protein n=1 Tax=Carnegiea gigantea TaxID=171969 RepID=A0A9Q1JQQ5_9CARY|nr:hypothetical protein Cgig2_027673 [Carnegiea gigantea]